MPGSVPCDACAFRRVKCDGNNPCRVCVKNGQSCTFLKIRRRRGPKGPRTATKAKVEQLQAQLSRPSAACSGLNSQPISLQAYFSYLDLYRDSLYTTWPIVSVESLKSRLKNRQPVDDEAHALAAALSAATILQLRMSRNPAMKQTLSLTTNVSAEDFVGECLCYRTQHNYRMFINLDQLLTSLFLHMYYANTSQMYLATFALRETVTYADLLRLGDSITLNSLCQEERELRLRVYWVLFVTER